MEFFQKFIRFGSGILPLVQIYSTPTCNKAISFRQNFTETKTVGKTQTGIFETVMSYSVHHTGNGAMFFLQYIEINNKRKLAQNKILPEMVRNGEKIGQITFLTPFPFSLQIQGSRFNLADLSRTICFCSTSSNASKGYINFLINATEKNPAFLLMFSSSFWTWIPTSAQCALWVVRWPCSQNVPLSDTIRRGGRYRGIFREEGVDTGSYFRGNHGSRVWNSPFPYHVFLPIKKQSLIYVE